MLLEELTLDYNAYYKIKKLTLSLLSLTFVGVFGYSIKRTGNTLVIFLIVL